MVDLDKNVMTENLIIEERKQRAIFKRLLIFSVVIVIFSFFAPWVFSLESFTGIFFNTKTGVVGDTIGGIMNPIIALVGVLVTFLAFYVQYRANKIQRESFIVQLKEDRIQFNNQLQLEKTHFKRSQFENQFYQMIGFHVQNVKDLKLKIDLSQPQSTLISGKEVFMYLLYELEFLYDKSILYNGNSQSGDNFSFIFREAYKLFFTGLSYFEKDNDFLKNIVNIKQFQLKDNFMPGRFKRRSTFDKPITWPLASGYSSLLANYFRHLFLTVKFVVNQDDNLISYDEKRNYLRVLRSQLSNEEQAMLFYNWLGGFGRKWEDENNKFFTDYRMIHNITKYHLFSGIELINLISFTGFKKESNRAYDPLFEFEES